MSAAFEAPPTGADVAVEQRADLWLAPVVGVRRESPLRRATEWSLTLALVALLSPLMLAIALVVAVTSEGPVLFRQQRVGLGGTTFELLKFRTMLVDAERRKAEVFALVNEASGPLTKLRRDPRVTGPGRALRRFSLDELPQLFNVLGGSMSLVGPRPALPEEVAQFAPQEHRRHAVRPGMTGLAQISGRSDLAWADAIRLDLRYVDHRTPALDLQILLRTVPAVLGARGAY